MTLTRKQMTARLDSSLRGALCERLFGDPNAVAPPPEGQGARNVNPKNRKRIRRQVFARDAFTCQECGLVAPPPEGWAGGALWSSEGIELTVDHVIPYSRGGRYTVANLRALCEPCNHARGDRPIR